MEATIEAVRRVCDTAAAAAAGGPEADEVAAVRERLDGPLRVAIAGRVKAGKSTLLNALVGDRVAATDASECTRVVTWYQDALGYDAVALLRDGTSASLRFRRDDGGLEIDLDGYAPSDLTRIEVRWPSSSLREITLIDTPGLASLDDENSLRTRDFLAFGDARPSDADAVIYLMPHLHRRDAEFLSAFMDRSVSASSPMNAVVVLSRADEIGAGRLDAMSSSARIADRYARDEELRTLCSAVVPIAGLLAEAGETLREDEFAALRTVAATDAGELDRMLLAVDTFLEPGASALTVEVRRQLVERLGMFGVRLAVEHLRGDGPTTASAVAHLLVDASGLDRLRRLLVELFLPRANVLKARSALAALRGVARALGSDGAELAREIEQCEAASLDFGLLRAVHLVRSGEAVLDDEETRAVDLLLQTGEPAAVRLGLAATAAPPDVRAAALVAVEHWRTRAAAPLASPAQTEVCEAIARIGEALYQEAAASS